MSTEWCRIVDLGLGARRTGVTFPGLKPFRTELILSSYLSYALARVQLAHAGNLQFAGILLSGHQHRSPPFNVAGPLNFLAHFWGAVHILFPCPIRVETGN